jgi:mRNA interferase YafQ
MREINQTGQFKRDLKREAKGMHRALLAKEFTPIIKLCHSYA